MAAEKMFENKIKRYLESIGVYPFGTPNQKMHVKPIGYYEKRWGGGSFTKNGLPDMHIVVRGMSIDLEIKAQNGKPSELQKFMISQIKDAGGLAFIVYPSGWNDLKRILDDLSNEIFNLDRKEILK